MWSDWKEKQQLSYSIPKRLLWDMDMQRFDLQKGRALVAERVAERGKLEDFYALFSLYGGVKSVRDIYKDEVDSLNSRTLAFICAAFNLKKEEMKCYTQKRSKAIPWNY